MNSIVRNFIFVSEHIAHVRELRRAAIRRRQILAVCLLAITVLVFAVSFPLHFSPLLALIPFVLLLLVLVLGLISTGIVGMAYGTFDVFGWFGAMGKGMTGMGELIIVTLMAGGMLELIRFNGGVDYVLHRLTQHVKGKRGAELSIAALVSLANICTANNTIAIITVGPLANDIAEQFRVDKRKSASILDTFSCVIQGIIPYGAQLLIAAELSGLSPINIIGYLYYPMTLGVVAILSILFRYPRRYS